MPMRQFQHTVTPDDTAAKLGTGDLDVVATPRLVEWCESAAFQVCQHSVDANHTTVGTMVKFEHIKGSQVGSEVTVHCAEPINDGRRLVCFVSIKDAEGDELGHGEVHRAIVDPDRFMTRCRKMV
ncbi:thioesterase family protein [Intrasporangium calvum]|uniref:thioesterase family protein n=1 Tax=Intrasporangium calvum TaxID=53358 RepID=UPI001F1F5621|nr:thioesterase [Intrasporangium calvum]